MRQPNRGSSVAESPAAAMKPERPPIPPSATPSSRYHSERAPIWHAEESDYR